MSNPWAAKAARARWSEGASSVGVRARILKRSPDPMREYPCGHSDAAGADPDAGTPSARQTAQMFAGADLLAVLDGGDAAPASEA